jgi:hypothetical protein
MIQDKARATLCLTCTDKHQTVRNSNIACEAEVSHMQTICTSEVVWRALAMQKGTPQILSCNNRTSATATAVALARCARTIPTVAAARAGASFIPSPTIIKPPPGNQYKGNDE